MDFQIGDIVQFKSLDLDYVSKDTWERIGGIDDLDSRYSLEHDYEVISILGHPPRQYLGIRSDGGVTFNIPKKYFKLIATRGFRIGDSIKTLKAFPNGGDVLKDEIGTIVGWSPTLYEGKPRAIIDFPSQSDYYAEITNSEKYTKVIFDCGDVVEIEEKVLKPGDCIEALVDYPDGGGVRKGEKGYVNKNRYVDFPSQKNYCIDLGHDKKKYRKICSIVFSSEVLDCKSVQPPIPPNPNITPSGLVEIPKPKKKKKEILVLSTKNITV